MSLRVKTYSGHKADERPTSFELDGREYEISEVLDRWYGPEYEYFRVRVNDGNTYILRHDRGQGGWSLTAFRREGS